MAEISEAKRFSAGKQFALCLQKRLHYHTFSSLLDRNLLKLLKYLHAQRCAKIHPHRRQLTLGDSKKIQSSRDARVEPAESGAARVSVKEINKSHLAGRIAHRSLLRPNLMQKKK